MARYLGINPEECFLRFHCRNDLSLVLMTGYKWKYEEMIRGAGIEPALNPYSYHGPSEDFAETFQHSVQNPYKLKSSAPQRNIWMEQFASSLMNTRGKFNRDDVKGILVPQDLPVPDCSVPGPQGTPRPPETASPLTTP